MLQKCGDCFLQFSALALHFNFLIFAFFKLHPVLFIDMGRNCGRRNSFWPTTRFKERQRSRAIKLMCGWLSGAEMECSENLSSTRVV